MSLRSWLFGEDVVTPILRAEIERLRQEVIDQREWWGKLYKGLEASNARLREELITLADAGAMAQVQAYRERRRQASEPGAAPPDVAPGRFPADIATAMNLQDSYLSGVVPEIPSENDEELERQVQAREASRLRAFERELASMDHQQTEV